MWFIFADPCGLACYVFGWITVLFVDYVLITEVLWPWLGGHWSGLLHIAGFQFLIALICGSYFKAATTDPGSVARRTASKDVIYAPESDPERAYKPRRRYCDKCECIKPPRAHHCSTCKRCINKMDHHCPWVNNCVGSNNLKFFLLFLLYVFLGGVYTALMNVIRFITCWRNPGQCPEPSMSTVILCVLSTILAIFFAIFTCAMAWDQWEGLRTNTTGIESMKGWVEEDTPLSHGLTEVFGEPFSWRWFAPVNVHETGEHTGFYAWSPDDDLDAYDVRDPMISKHFRRIESYLAEQATHQTREQAEEARRAAVHAAATIHRRHSLKKKAWQLPPVPPASAAGSPAPTKVEKSEPSGVGSGHDLAEGGDGGGEGRRSAAPANDKTARTGAPSAKDAASAGTAAAGSRVAVSRSPSPSARLSAAAAANHPTGGAGNATAAARRRKA